MSRYQMGSQPLYDHRGSSRTSYDRIEVERYFPDRNEFALRSGDVFQVVRGDREGQVTMRYALRFDSRAARWWGLVYHRNWDPP